MQCKGLFPEVTTNLIHYIIQFSPNLIHYIIQFSPNLIHYIIQFSPNLIHYIIQFSPNLIHNIIQFSPNLIHYIIQFSRNSHNAYLCHTRTCFFFQFIIDYIFENKFAVFELLQMTFGLPSTKYKKSISCS